MTSDILLVDLLEIKSSGDDGAEAKGGFEVKYATVVGLFDNGTAKICFAGEAAASEKEYTYLAWYSPQINDRIMLMRVNGVYIIIGKLVYKEPPGGGEDNLPDYITQEQLTNYVASALNAYAQKVDLNAYVKSEALDNYITKYSGGYVSTLPTDSSTTLIISRYNSLLNKLASCGLIQLI